jgi:CBS domain-containing protein
MRIQHQARQIRSGQSPDNFMDPADISNFERTQLKDAFQVVQSLPVRAQPALQDVR